MTAAQNYRDMRATADIRMALAPIHNEPERATAPTGPGDVWCHHCDQPATVEVRIATRPNGMSSETRAYCSKHITRLTIQTPLLRIEKTWENCNA